MWADCHALGEPHVHVCTNSDCYGIAEWSTSNVAYGCTERCSSCAASWRYDDGAVSANSIGSAKSDSDNFANIGTYVGGTMCCELDDEQKKNLRSDEDARYEVA